MTTNLFAVCPHDTARGVEKWALFNTFVNKNLGLGSRFQPYLDFTDFGADLEGERFLWAYLNPADYLKAAKRFGYKAVARPRGRFDVAYVLGRAEAGAASDPSALAGKRLAAVRGYLYFLVAHQLDALGVPFQPVTAKSYPEVMAMLERGDADFGVSYNEHFDALPPSVRQGYRVVARVDAGLSHVVATHPSLGQKEALRTLLEGAGERPEGRKMLAELKVDAFEPVPEEPFRRLREILDAVA